MAVAVPAILAAVSAAAAIKTGLDARKSAQAAGDLQEEQNKNLRISAAQKYNDLIPAQRDTFETSAEDSIQAQAELFRAKGQVNVLAGASGTYGGSVDSMLRDLNATHGQNIRNIVHNRENEISGYKAQAEGIRYGAQREQGNRYFAKPSYLGIGASAVGSAASSYYGAKGLQGAAPANQGAFNPRLNNAYQ